MDNLLHDRETPRSRRSLMKWAGQIAAGTSLAAIGLGLSRVNTALAQPDCTPCSGCVLTSCAVNGQCRANDPNAPLMIGYRLRLGCVPPGCYTSSTIYYECNSTCACYS